MKKTSIEERRKLIRAFRGSGKSAPEFCRKHGLHFTTLYSWMRANGRGEALRGFRRVKISGSPLMGLGGLVVAEVSLANGARVRVMRGCGEEEFSMVLKALGTCGS